MQMGGELCTQVGVMCHGTSRGNSHLLGSCCRQSSNHTRMALHLAGHRVGKRRPASEHSSVSHANPLSNNHLAGGDTAPWIRRAGSEQYDCPGVKTNKALGHASRDTWKTQSHCFGNNLHPRKVGGQLAAKRLTKSLKVRRMRSHYQNIHVRHKACCSASVPLTDSLRLVDALLG